MGNWAEIGHPHLQQGELPKCAGAGIYAAVQVDPLWPVRLQGLVKNSFICCRSSCTGRRTAEELVYRTWKNPTLGLVRNWLRPVNNYEIIIIQSKH